MDEVTDETPREVTSIDVSAAAAMDRFFTVREVANRLRVSNMTVYRIVRAGQLPAVQVGRGYRIREADLLKYLEDRYMDAG